MNQGTPAIRLTDLAKKFDRTAAVNGVSLDLQRGELLALLGPSGCGKTTTLRLIAGFERADRGSIEIGGETVERPGLHLPPEQRRVGMVFQEYALFPHMTVGENIRFGLHRYAGDRARRVVAVLELVGLEGLEQRMPSELSGGQQQRVALARALAPEPEVILLDEPFSNLDAGLRSRLRTELRTILRKAGATAVFVTHDQEEALSLVDQIAVIFDGVVVQKASPQELYHRPATRAIAEFIGDANVFPGAAHGSHAACELGTFELYTAQHGEVNVLVRPENISVVPATAAVAGHVTDVQFFGHDQLVTVRLDSGSLIGTRPNPLLHFVPGQPVALKATGPAMAWPRLD